MARCHDHDRAELASDELLVSLGGSGARIFVAGVGHDQTTQILDRFRCCSAEQLVDLAAQRPFLGRIEQPCDCCRAHCADRLRYRYREGALRILCWLSRWGFRSSDIRAPAKAQDNHEFQESTTAVVHGPTLSIA